MTQARQLLVALAEKVSNLQVVGEGRTAAVRVVLQGANFEEYMERARSKTQANHVRLQVLGELLREALGPETKSWKGGMEGPFVCKGWRGTHRPGWVAIKNVRELPNAAFKPEPGEDFRILIDYPWDEPGYDVESDRQRALDVRRRDGQAPTLCWLPRHMTPHELRALHDYAAAAYLTSDKAEELFSALSPPDRLQVVDQATSRLKMMRSKVLEILRTVYQHAVVTLIGEQNLSVPDFELSGNLQRLSEELLDRQYFHHPRFSIEPSVANVRALAEWLLEAADSPDQSAAYDADSAKVLKGLGVPLELVELGQTRGRLRHGTRYLKTVMDMAASERVPWARIDEALSQQYGLEPAVRNLFLAYVAQLQRFRMIRESGEPYELTLDNKAKTGVVLERAKLLDVAAWSRARGLGEALLDVQAPAHCTVSEQDRLAKQIVEAGVERHRLLKDAHERVAKLLPADQHEASPRLARLRETIARLGRLGKDKESFALLSELLTSFPDDATDPHRAVVKSARDLGAALGAIAETQRQHLLRATQHPVHGSEVQAHLDALTELLLPDTPLSVPAVERWNEAAIELVGKLVAGGRPTSSAPPPSSIPKPPPGKARLTHEARLNAGDPDALTDFWLALKKRVQEEKLGEVRVVVTIEEE